MIFHVFCEFADGSAGYLHLNTFTEMEAHRQAVRDHCALQVLWIICSADPICKVLELEYRPLESDINRNS